MRQFEQGGLDSLYLAKAALERAIQAYENAPRGVQLSLDSGPLFATNDHLTTVSQEINEFKLIANK